MARIAPYLLAALAAAAVLAVNYLSPFINPYFLQLLVYMGVNIILAASLNLINGFAGQFSLGHAGFMAIGAYSSAAFTFYLGGFDGTPAQAHGILAALTHAGVPASLATWLIFLAAIAIGGAGAAAAGLLVGLPTLRLRGDYLAIATLGFGEIVRTVISQIEPVGGPRGLSGVPHLASVAWVAACVALTLICLRNILASTHGRAFISVREDEIAASAVGVDTTRYKVLAFTIGAAFAGIAGVLGPHYRSYVHPNEFTFIKSIEIVVMVVLGGMGSLVGAAFAAIVLTLLPEILRTFTGAVVVAYCLAIGLSVAPAMSQRGPARRLALAAWCLAGLSALLTLLVPLDSALGAGFIIAAGISAAGFALASSFRLAAAVRLRSAATALLSAGLFALLIAGSGLLPSPLLAAKGWIENNVSQLRLVIYAALLVGLMLSRPRGLLGGHELTWKTILAALSSAARKKVELPGRGAA